MTRRYPAIQEPIEDGDVGLRDALTLKFFMPCSHRVVAPAVWRALRTFLRAIPREALASYATPEGEWEPLDEAGWEELQRHTFSEPLSVGGRAILLDDSSVTPHYAVEYVGRWLEDPLHQGTKSLASAVEFTLPTEYLEQQGPRHVRELALGLADELPFSFGYASLALIPSRVPSSMLPPLLARYPGLDVCHLRTTSQSIGANARGAYWLTFLGQPLLGRLGGLAALRQQLPFADTSFHALDDERVLLTLGEWPELAEAGPAPSLRALACLLEPFLLTEENPHISPLPEDTARWLRRFCG